MIVRARIDTDLDQCVALAQVVHQRDGYPMYLPTGLLDFLVSSDALGAWVADDDDEIVGHVALHPRSTTAAVALASEATRQPPERLGFVARLLVGPGARRQGIGEALLDVASQAAVDLGLWPVLDVVTSSQGAISLYEKAGWTRAGTVVFDLDDEFTVDEYVYIGPRRPG